MRRRLRLLLPPALALLLITITLIVHAVQQPDDTDESFLSPVSAAGDGARDLAARLAARGIAVDRRVTTPEALGALTPGSTLFVTTPALVNPAYLARFRNAPDGVRVVLVAPGLRTLRELYLNVDVAGPRWTAAAVAPGCADATGTAALLRLRYRSDDAVRSCYDGGLLDLDRITLVGASDPFRNDRLGEHDNAAVAEAVLARGTRVVWLDLHAEEPSPYEPRPGATTDDPEPTTRTEVPDETGEDPGGEPGPPTAEAPREDQPDRADPPPSPYESVPAAFWATVLLLVLAALAAAAAAARRLGAPVSEPLPARVRAAESVAGLGGLYRRAGARDESLARVRDAVRHRLAAHFGLAPDTPADVLADRVAAVTGRPAHDVRRLLHGEPVYDDDGLIDQATAVQALLTDVRNREAGVT